MLPLWSVCGVPSVSRIGNIIGFFCKRALSKRRYSAKEAYNWIESIDRSHHPIPSKFNAELIFENFYQTLVFENSQKSAHCQIDYVKRVQSWVLRILSRHSPRTHSCFAHLLIFLCAFLSMCVTHMNSHLFFFWSTRRSPRTRSWFRASVVFCRGFPPDTRPEYALDSAPLFIRSFFSCQTQAQDTLLILHATPWL